MPGTTRRGALIQGNGSRRRAASEKPNSRGSVDQGTVLGHMDDVRGQVARVKWGRPRDAWPASVSIPE